MRSRIETSTAAASSSTAEKAKDADDLKPSAHLEWLSTTIPSEAASKNVKGKAAVQLLPTEEASPLGLQVLSLGDVQAGFPAAVHIGSHKDCEGRVQYPGASELQCQFTLRSFTLPQHGDEVREALFVRDVAVEPAPALLINGQPAFRPWQWLHDGDSIGLNGGILYKVRYCSHQQLRRSEVDLHVMPPVVKVPEIVEGAPEQKPPKAAAKAKRGPRKPAFTTDIIGKVVDVTYEDPVATYRVKITRYDPATKWHHVDSEGYSVWKDEEGDESFLDEIDLNAMHARGLVAFVEEGTKRLRRK